MGKTMGRDKRVGLRRQESYPVAEKIQHSSIVNYVNTPLMASFGGTKETAVKFIISRYHNGRFYFDQPVDISGGVLCPCSTALQNTYFIEQNPILFDEMFKFYKDKSIESPATEMITFCELLNH